LFQIVTVSQITGNVFGYGFVAEKSAVIFPPSTKDSYLRGISAEEIQPQ